MVIYNKLVRDNMAEIVERNGNRATFCTVPAEEFAPMLRQKLLEEVTELLQNPGSAEELADVQEVLDALITVHEMRGGEPVSEARNRKLDERGGFFCRQMMLWGEFINEIPGHA